MNRFKVFCFFAAVFLLSSIVHARTLEGPSLFRPVPGPVQGPNGSSRDAPDQEDVSKDIAQLIVGKWTIAPNTRAAQGTIVFNRNGSYELQEQLADATGVGTKGGFKLNSRVTPATIDLCLGKCDEPGSEWTTRFGIIRVLPGGQLEIRTSSDGKYPSGFSDDTSDEQTMILTRSK